MAEAKNIEISAGVDVGEIVECTVEQIMPYGAFVKIAKTGRKGMIHISELSYSFVKDINAVLKIGDSIKAKVIRIDERGRIDLSLKQTQTPPERPARPLRKPSPGFTPGHTRETPPDSNGRAPGEIRARIHESQGRRDFHEMQSAYREANPDEADSFEKKMASFLKVSEAKITDLNTRNSARSGRPPRRRNSRES